jgi:hypothetical protein
MKVGLSSVDRTPSAPISLTRQHLLRPGAEVHLATANDRSGQVADLQSEKTCVCNPAARFQRPLSGSCAGSAAGLEKNCHRPVMADCSRWGRATVQCAARVPNHDKCNQNDQHAGQECLRAQERCSIQSAVVNPNEGNGQRQFAVKAGREVAAYWLL